MGATSRQGSLEPSRPKWSPVIKSITTYPLRGTVPASTGGLQLAFITRLKEAPKMLTILALAVAALQAAPERGEHTQHLTKCAAVCQLPASLRFVL